jgi:hypothetical protein
MLRIHPLLLPVLTAGLLLTSCRERPAKANVKVPPPATAPAETKPPAAAPGAGPAAPASPAIPASAQVANPGPIKAAVMKYYQTEGRFPNDWETLVKQKYLPAVPKTASGQPADFRAFMRHHSL